MAGRGDGDEMMGKGFEGSVRNKEKTLEQSGVAEARQGRRTEGLGLMGGGWVQAESKMPSYRQMSLEDLGIIGIKREQPKIKEKLILWHPNGLGQIRGMAQLREAVNMIVKGVSVVSGPRFSKSFTAQNGEFRKGFQT